MSSPLFLTDDIPADAETWLQHPSTRQCVAARLNFTCDVLDGAESIIRLRLSLDRDHIEQQTDEVRVLFAGRSRQQAAEHVEDCMQALRLGYELLSRSDLGKSISVGVYLPAHNIDLRMIVSALLGSCGGTVLSLTTTTRDASAPWYKVRDQVCRRITSNGDAGPRPELDRSDVDRIIQGKRLVKTNAAAGRDTTVTIFNVEDAEPDVFAPLAELTGEHAAGARSLADHMRGAK